ncbi:MAG: hypothetical protein HC796_00095 [Synechococcaceae cyanobacterium RL_1_2]|nr:hypothetical protein [Synechococcaceae cyanobacterium RL_1_2]
MDEFVVDLISSQNKVIGYLGIRYATTNVNNNLEYSYALIRVFARRAAVELERQSIYKELEEANQLLELKIAERTEALEYANYRLTPKFEQIEQQKEVILNSQKRFRSLVDNLPGVVYRCRADEHLSVEFVSEAIEELSGYSCQRFIEGKK